MTFLGILTTVFIAIIVAVVFYYIFNTTGPWNSFWSFLLVLILVGLAAAHWITPAGPVLWDLAWVPTLFAIIIFALLLGAASPPRKKMVTMESNSQNPLPNDKNTAAIGALFWIFLIVILGIIIWKYIGDHPLTRPY